MEWAKVVLGFPVHSSYPHLSKREVFGVAGAGGIGTFCLPFSLFSLTTEQGSFFIRFLSLE